MEIIDYIWSSMLRPMAGKYFIWNPWNNMRKFILSIVLVVATGCCADNIEVSRIWDENYSAFPSIVEFQGKYYVAFREASSHIFDENGNADGKARILVSNNGRRWKSVALIEKPGTDLRDPKLSVTPDGRLMVTLGGSLYKDRELVSFFPHVAFSNDGCTFSAPEKVCFDSSITDEREWIWRLTWHEGVGYGVSYGEHFALVKTTDGVNYQTVCELNLDRALSPGESTIRFASDGRMYMMVRCESGDSHGRWGVSEAPYTDWKWGEMDFHLGGPDFIILDDGRVVAGSRYHFPRGKCRTMVLTGDLDGNFEERWLLPSGGDTSYPGFLDRGNELWMVYYSCHETADGGSHGTIYDFDPSADKAPRASIYLARIPKKLL